MLCGFSKLFGNSRFKKESLAEAWNNEYAQMLRKRHLEHNLEGTLCYNCLKNCVSTLKPLRTEYAVPFDIFNYDKSKEIEKKNSKIGNQ